jgi:beta-lactam-binding protein with PASTA domain
VVDQGSRISVTIATGADLVTVPDLRGVPEANAFGLLSDAGLVVGSRTETPDQLVVSGSIIGQDPPAATEVPRGTPVSYVVSTGPPSAPTRGPSPTPAPLVTASPPIDGSLVVGDYQCLTLVEATARLERDGFSRGTISYSIEGGPVDDTWIVQSQAPLPGARRPPGAGVNLLLASPFSTCLGE